LFLANYKYSAENSKRIGSIKHTRSSNYFSSIFKQSAYKTLTQSGNIVDLNSHPQPKNSLLLICSKNVAIFPWELMFEQFSTRSLTLNHELIRMNNLKSNDRSIPSYFCFYSEDAEKFISPAELHRKKWILSNIQNNLSLSDTVRNHNTKNKDNNIFT
jgi:hypothetical protein